MAQEHIDKLKRLMPPISPAPQNEVDWKMAESVFGIVFPDDFKEFVQSYGNVIWCDLFRVIYPDTSSPDACQATRKYVAELLDVMFSDDDLVDESGHKSKFVPYPQKGGLLPCIIDNNSAIICWLTAGDPNQWKTVRYITGEVVLYPLDFTSLLSNWIEQISPADKVWGQYFLSKAKYGIKR